VYVVFVGTRKLLLAEKLKSLLIVIPVMVLGMFILAVAGVVVATSAIASTGTSTVIAGAGAGAVVIAGIAALTGAATFAVAWDGSLSVAFVVVAASASAVAFVLAFIVEKLFPDGKYLKAGYWSILTCSFILYSIVGAVIVAKCGDSCQVG
jgi:hypothetical protein